MSEKKSNEDLNGNHGDNTFQDSSCSEQAGIINDGGEALYIAGNKEEALARFKEAIELDPECVHAYSNIGVYHWDTGDLAASISWFQKALTIKPDDLETLTNLETILKLINQEKSVAPPPDED